MLIKTLVPAVAIALASTFGSASAADPFSTLDGVSAQPMNSEELAAVSGKVLTIAFDVVPTPFLSLFNVSRIRDTGNFSLDAVTFTMDILVASPRNL